MKSLIGLFCTALVTVSVSAQQTPATFDPLQVFAPLTLPDPVNAYRSANGAPGPMYWQNRVDYDIHAAIDTQSKVLTATEVVTYTNNSPDALPSLWMQLDQNIYRADARSNAAIDYSSRRRRGSSSSAANHTDGYAIESVTALGTGKHATETKLAFVISDTRMQVRLAQPLLHGQQMRFEVKYHYTVPGLFGGRTSWGKAQQGEIYDIAQWFPRMAVYDDLHGWDTQPYLANEFYCEYGNIDYAVTVPANFIVTGSGALMNEREVLSPMEQQRMAQARASDATVMIRTVDEATKNAAMATPAATRTWRFRMENTRDAAFSASPAFVWDAARIHLNGIRNGDAVGKDALAQSLYPVESAGDAAWGRSTEYLKDAVEHFSQRWYPYPYPNAINVAGPSSGMEYPGILFDGIPDQGKELFWVTAHEIGHTWFPMLVGFNERRHAWMDEGFNTFIDIYESDDFKGGVYGPKRDGEYAPDEKVAPADQIAKLLQNTSAPPILMRADAIREQFRHPVTYFKSAFGLWLLREDILGQERFDWTFRKFIRDWAYKHPSPSDFFRAMASEGGEDLDYFWRGYYFTNAQLDFAVTDAKYVDGDAAKGVQVTVASRGSLVVPTTLEAVLADGSKVRVAVPAETWIQGASHTFVLATSGPVASVTIDPEHRVPDVDRSNNTVSVP